MTPQAAAVALGVSTRQAQRLCADAGIRMRRDQRPYLYHGGDVAQLGEQRIQQAQRVMDATSRVVSRPDEWRGRYDQERAKVESAAHTIGQLEERVRHLEAQRDARPLLEDHAALRAQRDALAADVDRLRHDLERARRPWWKRWLTT